MKKIMPTDIEVMAAKARMRMNKVCKLAGVSQSTFSKWKGSESKRPRQEVIDKLITAMTEKKDAAE